MTTYHVTPKSSNKKTGPIPVTTTSANTCPDACPLKKNGCYADGGPLAIHWRKVTAGERGTDLAGLCDFISDLPEGQLWRHNQAGDLPGTNDSIDISAMLELIHANRGRRGFTYTHKPLNRPSERAVIRDANANGFTVNLSANTPEHADELSELNIGPVVTLLPADTTAKVTRTPAGRKVITCPAAIDNPRLPDCATCGMCASADRDTIIGFPAHGASKKKATLVSLGGTS